MKGIQARKKSIKLKKLAKLKRTLKKVKRGGAYSITIDGIEFELVGKQLFKKGERQYVKIVSTVELDTPYDAVENNMYKGKRVERNTFFCYKSRSEGFWRFACLYDDNMYKGEDYITETFIHIELQKFISENITNVPDIEIEIPSSVKVKDLLNKTKYLEFTDKFKELLKISCSTPVRRSLEGMFVSRSGAVSTFGVLNLLEEAEKNNNLLLQQTIHTYLDLNKNAIDSDLEELKLFYKILNSYVASIMSVNKQTLRFQYAFNHFIGKNVNIIFNVYSVDVKIDSTEFSLIFSKYKYINKGFEKEYNCIVNLIPKENKITIIGLYENVVSVGKYLCKPFDYWNQIGVEINDDVQREINPNEYGVHPSNRYYFVGDLIHNMYPLNELDLDSISP